jgi:hypothetical protein
VKIEVERATERERERERGREGEREGERGREKEREMTILRSRAYRGTTPLVDDDQPRVGSIDFELGATRTQER